MGKVIWYQLLNEIIIIFKKYSTLLGVYISNIFSEFFYTYMPFNTTYAYA